MKEITLNANRADAESQIRNEVFKGGRGNGTLTMDLTTSQMCIIIRSNGRPVTMYWHN